MQEDGFTPFQGEPVIFNLEPSASEDDRDQHVTISISESASAAFTHGLVFLYRNEMFWQRESIDIKEFLDCKSLTLYFNGPAEVATIVRDATVAAATSGVTTLLYNL